MCLGALVAESDREVSLRFVSVDLKVPDGGLADSGDLSCQIVKEAVEGVPDRSTGLVFGLLDNKFLDTGVDIEFTQLLGGFREVGWVSVACVPLSPSSPCDMSTSPPLR